MIRNIVLTGGGTAGHVTPNMALIDVLQQEGWHIDYVGSVDGVEKDMIGALGVPFHAVSSGKLRRYFSWKNALDPFKILWGIVQSYFLLRRLKPDVVFSKGGFVAFPVVVGAWLHRISVVAHESDMTPGLANRLSYPFVRTICVNFPATKSHFKRQTKVVVTGTPIRKQLFQGTREQGLALCGFNEKKPCLLVVGGSQGAQTLNACVREALTILCTRFQVIHLCGKGKIDFGLVGQPGYCQFEYAKEELADLFAASELVISRAGANALCEILALEKPHVLVPLSPQASRGDQVENARYFEQQGLSVVVADAQLTPATLLQAIDEVFEHRVCIVKKIKKMHVSSATEIIVKILSTSS